MEEMGLPELTSEQMEKLCEIAEQAAREHILSKLTSNKISSLDVTIDTEGTHPITVSVDVRVNLVRNERSSDVDKLVNEATKKAFMAVEEYLRTIACESRK